ncbi:MAG: hypothetical protein ACYTJ0_10470 [Planctomycetota bacterium]|jgi:hypothetical protein
MDATGASEHDFAESMHAFEAAVSAQAPRLIEPRVERILWAPDGSNQDDTASALAMMMARRLEASITVIGAGPVAEARRKVLEELGLAGEAVALADGRPAFEQILEACSARRCGLVVVNAPFGEDFEQLGDGSVGTTLDMLLARRAVPLLVVREAKADPGACLGHVLVPLTLHEPTVSEAASWALRVVDVGGDLRLLAVIDREHVEASVEAVETDVDVEELDEPVLAGIRRPEMAGLIGAVQRSAARRGLGCRVSVRVGAAVTRAAELADEREALVVTGCPRDPIATGYQRVQALLRASRNPLLIV